MKVITLEGEKYVALESPKDYEVVKVIKEAIISQVKATEFNPKNEFVKNASVEELTLLGIEDVFCLCGNGVFVEGTNVV